MKNLLELWVEIGVWDKDGKFIHKQKELSRSPVKQLLEHILSGFRGTVAQAMVDTGGVSRSVYAGITSPPHWMEANATLNNSAYGIVIGTGITAVDMTNYQLVAQITHGIAIGQMVHNYVMLDATVTVVDPNATFVLYRNFNNNSGASITVGETGIYLYSGGYIFCVIRDVPTSVAVPDGGGCYVKYTLKITE